VPVPPPTSDAVLLQLRARLDQLMSEFRTLLVAYLLASGAGR
jgi:hypothetical protein